MDRAEAIRQVAIAWMAFGGVWLLAALRQNRAKKREAAFQQIVRNAMLAGAALLLYDPKLPSPALNRPFLPPAVRNAGWFLCLAVVIVWLGVAFAVWARIHIGRYWSGTISLRKDHQLIRSGPYAWIRHPIYTGMILALFGAMLAIGQYRALVGFVIFAAGLVWKAKREEALLAGEFGPAFAEHRRATGFLLPRLRRPAPRLAG